MNDKQKRDSGEVRAAKITTKGLIIVAIIGLIGSCIGIFACQLTGVITIDINKLLEQFGWQIVSTTPQATSIPTSTVIPINQPTPIQIAPFCGAFLTPSQIASLQQIQDIKAVVPQAEQFAGYRQNNYVVGDLIPVNVVIATNLYTDDFESIGVIPINNSGGYGLFLTTQEIVATYPGTYWCIQDNVNPTAIPITSVPVSTPQTTIISTSVSGCLGLQHTGMGTEIRIKLNVPDKYVQYLWGSRFDDISGIVQVQVIGPYNGEHDLYEGGYCEPVISESAEDVATLEQVERELGGREPTAEISCSSSGCSQSSP